MSLLETLDPRVIRRDTPIPCHYQLSELLRQEIEAGHWGVGEQIPVEEDLCAHFNLSRTTVRKALDGLVNMGLLRRVQGRGTFVAEPKLLENMVNRAIGFYDDMHERGIQVQSKVLELRRVTPPPAVARELEIDPDTLVIEISRVRMINEVPVVVVSSYVPFAACPSLLDAAQELEEIGLHQYMRAHGSPKVGHAKSFIEAVGANEMEAEQLAVEVGAPLIMIEATVYAENGKPMDYYKSRHRGDRLRLVVESGSVGFDPIQSKRR